MNIAVSQPAAGRNLLTTCYQKLLINMSAAGLCVLRNLSKLAEATRERLFLCPSVAVKQILKMNGFDNVLPIRDSVKSALVE